MAYVDLNTLHNPATGTSPPASWGDAVRDNFDYFNSMLAFGTGAWGTFTPAVLQSISVSRTVVYARYWKAGRFVAGQCMLNITSSGTANQAIVIGAPVTAAAAANLPCGFGFHYNGSINIPFQLVVQTTTAFAAINYVPSGGYYGASAIPLPVIGGATSSLATQLLNTHSLTFFFHYESAT